MAKLKTDPITKSDMIEYLASTSDFAFELKCLEMMGEIGFKCSHGGPYTDPITNKTRQFDIRAQRQTGNHSVLCAIECKNLRSSFPLLVMCVPRTQGECFHQLSISSANASVLDRDEFGNVYVSRNFTCSGKDSAYKLKDPVGKNCPQVGRLEFKPSEIFGSDAEIFEKWSQALSSAAGLARDATRHAMGFGHDVISLILPIVVVPDGMLWQINFESNGSIAGEPFQTDRCSFFVRQEYRTDYTVSHLEMVTFTGLRALLSNMLPPNRDPDRTWFTGRAE